MRADSPRALGAGLLRALLSAGCASLPPPPGRGTSLRYTRREAARPAWAEGPSEESPLALSSPLPSPPEPEAPERLHRRRGSREEVTGAGSDRVEGDSRLEASGRGLARGNGVFLRYADFGAAQPRWIETELAATTELANAASGVEDPDMQLTLLRLTGPRLEAAMLGSMLLAIRLDFLHREYKTPMNFVRCGGR